MSDKMAKFFMYNWFLFPVGVLDVALARMVRQVADRLERDCQ